MGEQPLLMKRIVYLLLVFISKQLLAQSSVGDDCSSATLLTVGSSCTLTSYTTLGATSSTTPSPACHAYLGNDVWFKLTVPASGHLQIKLQQSGPLIGWALYSGTSCTSLVKTNCFLGSLFHNINNPSLAGTELYIRVWRYNSLTSTNFSICAWEPNTPSNDSCSNALDIVPGNACSMTTYTTYGATTDTTGTAPSPTCGVYQGGDVWFKTTVPSSGKLRFELSNVSSINAYYAIYSGTCGAFTQLFCGGNQAFNINNLSMAGSTLYIRVFDLNNSQGGGSFNLCVWEPATASNDNCSDAIVLPVQSTCVPSPVYSTTGATAEPLSVVANPGCGFYGGGDIWFKVVVPASGKLRIERNIISGAVSYAFYTGSCGNFNEIRCTYPSNSVNFNDPALANQSIYIRAWYTNNAYGVATFTICAWEPPTLANDFCANAISLPVNTMCTASGPYSTIGVTSEPLSVAPNPTCGFYDGGDLWYKFTMPLSGHARIERPTGNAASFAVYTGSCGNFQPLECAYSTNYINIHNHGLGGQTVYVRVWYTNSNFLEVLFTLCVWEPATLENDFCSTPQNLTVTNSCIQNTYSLIGCTGESSMPTPSCNSSATTDLWFTLTMPASGMLKVSATGTSGNFQPQLALYSGSCTSFTPLICSSATSPVNVLNYSNASLAGQTVYLRLWDLLNDGSSVNLCVQDPSCIITLDSIVTTPVSCNAVADGSITVYANCLSCQSSMQYALDNGSYQNSSFFNNVTSGNHLIHIRDNVNNTCSFTSSYFNVSYLDAANFYYQDNDLDGYGNSSVYQYSCNQPQGYILQNGDCNDNNNAIHPGAQEITCNGIDENCSNNIDDTPGEINVHGQCVAIANNSNQSYFNIPNGTYFDHVPVGGSLQRTFTLTNTEPAPIVIYGITSTMSAFTISSISFPYTLPLNQSVSFDVTFSPSAIGNYSGTIMVLNSDCDEASFQFTVSGDAVNSSSLTPFQIHALIEGFYLGANTMNTVLLNQGKITCNDICDSVTVVLHDAVTLAATTSYRTVLKTNGVIDCRFVNLLSTNYYIELRHRNGLKSWSAAPVAVVPNGQYNFTSSAMQTYGANSVEMEPGIFAIYSGDINQDDALDVFDYLQMEPDIIFGNFGYLAEDVNGDGSVDSFDYLILEPHITDGINAAIP